MTFQHYNDISTNTCVVRTPSNVVLNDRFKLTSHRNNDLPKLRSSLYFFFLVQFEEMASVHHEMSKGWKAMIIPKPLLFVVAGLLLFFILLEQQNSIFSSKISQVPILGNWKKVTDVIGSAAVPSINYLPTISNPTPVEEKKNICSISDMEDLLYKSRTSPQFQVCDLIWTLYINYTYMCLGLSLNPFVDFTLAIWCGSTNALCKERDRKCPHGHRWSRSLQTHFQKSIYIQKVLN